MSTHQPTAAKGGKLRAPAFFAVMAVLIVIEGLSTGWNGALGILNESLLLMFASLFVGVLRAGKKSAAAGPAKGV